MSNFIEFNKCIGGPKDGRFVSVPLATSYVVPDLNGEHYYLWNDRDRSWEYDRYELRSGCSGCSVCESGE